MKFNLIVQVLLSSFAVMTLGATVTPTLAPSEKPSVTPTIEPSMKPTVMPTEQPSEKPTVEPSVKPTVGPTVEPSIKPTVMPTEHPSVVPTVEPSVKPTVVPTIEPSVKPTVAPTVAPTVIPTIAPTVVPTVVPTVAPTVVPTVVPTIAPTVTPTIVPTVTPTVVPTVTPTISPTAAPTIKPTVMPTMQPSEAPTRHPTVAGPGWLIEYYYGSNNTYNDGADPLAVYGRRTGECLEGQEFYYVASCGTDYATLLAYNTSDCSGDAFLQYEVAYDQEYSSYYGAPVYFDSINSFSAMKDAHYVRYVCTANSEQFSFVVDGNATYAVTEFYSPDETATDDQMSQCTNDYIEFSAYRKNYCFNVIYWYFFSQTYQYNVMFTAEDDTYIRSVFFNDNQCHGYGRVNNLFEVDTCFENGNDRENFIRADEFDHNAMKKSSRGTKTPKTLLHQLGTDALRVKEGKKVLTNADRDQLQIDNKPKVEQYKAKHANGKNIAAGSEKETEGFSSFYNWYYYTSETYFALDYEDASNYYFAEPVKEFNYLSVYHKWTNVPALSEDTPAPYQWFTEMLFFGGDYTNMNMVNTRKTGTCMQFYFGEEIMFNYKVVCDAFYEQDDSNDDAYYNQVHVLQYGRRDWDCSGDHIIVNYRDYYFGISDDEIGRKEFWNFDHSEYECSNTQWGSHFANITSSGEASFATEVFYPLTSNGTSECTEERETDIVMGVAWRQDHCFNFWADYNTNDDGSVETKMSFEYVANLENQNIEFTVYNTKDCRERFIHQTKEIEINTCNDEQPNSFYNPVEKFGPVWGRKLNAEQKVDLEKSRTALTKAMEHFNTHPTYGTPFDNALETRAKNLKKRQAAHKTTAAAADKEAESTSYSYYYYYDDAAWTLNNRPGFNKNMWFSVPTTPTIAPSVVPTVAPSEMPSEHPSVMPTIMPSMAPSEIPTIAPSMAPNPPTLRPTPLPGQPTAYPTHQTTYSFSVVQVLDGINKANFEDDENNYEAFEEACAMAMPPLTSDNIDIVSVEDATRRRALRALQSSAVDITYTVTYTVAETGYNDAQTAYDALIASLTTAIVDTDLFDGYIQVSAEEFDASDLLGTTSDSFEASEATVTGHDDDSKPTLSDHRKLVVGLVVGLGGGLLFIAIIAYCIFGMGGNESQGYSNPQSVTVNNNARAFEMTSVDPTTGKSAL